MRQRRHFVVAGGDTGNPYWIGQATAESAALHQAQDLTRGTIPADDHRLVALSVTLDERNAVECWIEAGLPESRRPPCLRRLRVRILARYLDYAGALLEEDADGGYTVTTETRALRYPDLPSLERECARAIGYGREIALVETRMAAKFCAELLRSTPRRGA